MILLRLLGGLSLETDRARERGFEVYPARLAVLSILAAFGGEGISRDRLSSLLWPEKTLDRARGSLKQALFLLRRDLDEGELTVGKATLRLNSSRVESDLCRFRSALEECNFSEVVRLYRGPFLDGIHIKESPEFERWSDSQRQSIARDYQRCLERLACDAESRSDLAGALEWWSLASRDFPFSGRIALRHMHALVAADDREEAIQHGLKYQRLLRFELDAEADERIEKLVLDLRRRVPIRHR